MYLNNVMNVIFIFNNNIYNTFIFIACFTRIFSFGLLLTYFLQQKVLKKNVTVIIHSKYI